MYQIDTLSFMVHNYEIYICRIIKEAGIKLKINTIEIYFLKINLKKIKIFQKIKIIFKL